MNEIQFYTKRKMPIQTIFHFYLRLNYYSIQIQKEFNTFLGDKDMNSKANIKIRF